MSGRITSSELAILLYNHGVSLRKIEQILGWLGVERSHVAIWRWIQKFGQRLAEVDRRSAADVPAVVLMDETVITQQGEEFTLFAAVAPSRNTHTTRRFLTELAELYGQAPPIVVTGGPATAPSSPHSESSTSSVVTA